MSARGVSRTAALLLVVGGFALGQVAPELVPGGPATRNDAVAETPAAPQPVPTAAPIPPGLSSQEIRDIEIFRRSSASVAFITSVAYRRDFFSMDVMQIPQGSGSGFVWDRAGHIVTNFHVISEGNAFRVTLADQSEWDGTVVGVAPDKDLAVLKIDAGGEHLVPLPVGTSRDLAVGQRVLAIGNPFGLDHSLTVGVVSALGRELQSPTGRIIRDVIQTDAAINPGNSGGPLLDSTGHLIAINTAIYSPSGASAGIGFGVPVDTVATLVPQLIDHGKVIEPGIGIVPLSDRWAQRLHLDGVVIREVDPGSPAARAGIEGLTTTRTGRLRLGDRIVAVNGTKVTTVDDMLYAFEAAGVGASVTLTVAREGRERTVELALVRVN